MSLQSRILELLTTTALPPKSLYWLLRAESREAVDAAIKALRGNGEIIISDGYFRRAGVSPVCVPNSPVAEAPGQPPRRHARVAAELGAPLTLREIEIADLAATMRPISELAAELGITAKTLYGALGCIYAKLGVRGRQELARAVAEREGAA